MIVENVLAAPELPRRRFAAVAARRPVVAHGVSLNLLGADPLDPAHVDALAAFVREHDVPWVSDHLCWSRTGAAHHHDLLPAPYDPALVDYAAERIRYVQARLGVPFAVENLSSYLTWSRDAVAEWAFVRAVVERAGCHLLLDVNNVFVSSRNHGFDPLAYLDAVDWDRVLEVHLAGHETLPDGRRHDTHDRPVDPAVWALYAAAWRRGGPFPTLLEWDEHIPPLAVAVAELEKARGARVGGGRGAGEAAEGPAAGGSPEGAVRARAAGPADRPADECAPPRLAPPAWLVALQAEFGAVLRAPLDPTSGTFRPVVDAYPAPLVAALAPAPAPPLAPVDPDPRARLAVYHRQYWMRIFHAFQQGFPTLTRALGPWWLNRLVALHVGARAPSHFDLDRAGDGFAEAVAAAAGGVAAGGVAAGGVVAGSGAEDGPRAAAAGARPAAAHPDAPARSGVARPADPARRAAAHPDAPARPAPARPVDPARRAAAHPADPWLDILRQSGAPAACVAQAAALDQADRAAFAGPWAPPWRPTPEEARALGGLRLRVSPSLRIVRVDWDFSAARPAPAAPVHVVFARTETGVARTAVPLAFGRLLEEARARPFGEALALVSGEGHGDALAAHLPAWIAQAVRAGWWVGAGP